VPSGGSPASARNLRCCASALDPTGQFRGPNFGKTARDANIGKPRLFLACQIGANAFGKDFRWIMKLLEFFATLPDCLVGRRTARQHRGRSPRGAIARLRKNQYPGTQ
jgi:hypothetical protein